MELNARALRELYFANREMYAQVVTQATLEKLGPACTIDDHLSFGKEPRLMTEEEKQAVNKTMDILSELAKQNGVRLSQEGEANEH